MRAASEETVSKYCQPKRKPTNWGEYADGTWYTAEALTDYEDPKKFIANGRQWAFYKKMNFERRELPGSVVFRFTPKAGTE